MIEALLAGVLLAMIGVAIGGGVAQSLWAAADSSRTRRAAELLDQTMTKIDMIGPARLLTQGPLEGSFDPPDQRYSWTARIEELTEPDLYQVTLTITWAGARGPRSAQVVTRLHDPAGSRNPDLYWEDL